MTITRTSVFIGSFLAFIGLLSQYATLPDSLAKRFAPPQQVALEQAISQLMIRDPNAANLLRNLQDNRERRAIEAALREQQSLPGGDVLRSAEVIARNLTDSTDSLATQRYELAKIAGDTNLLHTQAERDAFVIAHATALDALTSLQKVPEQGKTIAEQSVSDYMSRLRKATAQPALFRRTASDPIAMVLFEEVADEDVRDFYIRSNDDRTHPDWLKEVTCPPVRHRKLS